MYQNPINDFYFRNSQPTVYQSGFMQPQYQRVNTRFVTNIEEAKAAIIDGYSTNLFLDSGNGKIYLKQFNNNGLSDFLVYSIDEQNTERKTDTIEQINTRLSNIENILGDFKNGNESIQNNAIYEQSSKVDYRRTTEQASSTDEYNGTTESAGVPKNAGNDKWQKRK